MLKKPIKDDSEDEEDDFDFEVDSDEGINVGINLPTVAKKESKTPPQPEAVKPIQRPPSQHSKNMLDNLLQMSEEEIQEKLEDEEKKGELIQQLLQKEEAREASRMRSVYDPDKYKSQQEKDYPGKEDPDNPENEVDFKKAYNKLAQRMQGDEEEEGISKMLLTDRDIEKADYERQTRENAAQFTSRVLGFADNAKKLRELRKEEASDKLMKECTFSPQIIRVDDTMRSHIEFIKDQEKFLKRKEDNINRIADDNAKIKADNFRGPRVDPNSESLASSRRGAEPIYERLYGISKKSIQTDLFPSKEKKKKAVPSGNRNLHLYNLAAKQKEERKEPVKEKRVIKKIEASKDPMISQRFKREFYSALNVVGVPSENTRLCYEEMKVILLNLFMIKSVDDKENDIGSIMAQQMWKDLKGDETEGILPDQLLPFLGAVCNIKIIPDEVDNSNPSIYEEKKGETKESFSSLPEEVIVQIHRNYDALYVNRKSYKPAKPPVQGKQIEFKPSICGESSRIIEMKRSREIFSKDLSEKKAKDPHSSVFDPVSHFGNDLVKRKKEQEEKHIRLKKEKEKLERDACTFRPQIIEYLPDENAEKEVKKVSKAGQSTLSPSQDRCKMLYSLSKNIPKRPDKPAYICKFEKEPKEFTFRPNTSKEPPKDTTTYFAKNIDKTIQRMKQAREEKQRVNKALQIRDEGSMKFTFDQTKFRGSFNQFQKTPRGTEKSSLLSKSKMRSIESIPEKVQEEIPFSKEQTSNEVQNVEEEFKQEEEENLEPTNEREIMLFIDVNLGAQQQRIVVYKGDEASDLAMKFAIEHNLDNKAKMKLEMLIDQQIKQQLDKIEEEGVSEEDLSSPPKDYQHPFHTSWGFEIQGGRRD